MSRGIDIARWREYPEVLTDSLWLFPKRGEGGDGGYRGNFVPQIPEQLMLRYTTPGDLVVDWFAGSGTTLHVAQRLRRRAYGFELGTAQAEWLKALYQDNPEICVVQGDSRNISITALLPGHDGPVMLSILHPPYMDIVRFTDDTRDLSRHHKLGDFLYEFLQVMKRAVHVAAPGGTIAVVIGDLYRNGEVVPLAAELLTDVCRQFPKELRLKGIVVKDIQGNEQGKGKDGNLWRYRALKHGFFVFKHEYVYIWERSL